MRSCSLLIGPAFVLLFGASALTLPTLAQTSGKTCEPTPALKQSLQKLAEEVAPLPIKQKRERELASLKALLKDQPGDLFVHRRYQEAWLTIYDNDPAQLIEEYRLRAAAQPNDATAHYLYAAALKGRGTKEAIAQAEQALRLQPGLGRADQLLTEIYQIPAYRDSARQLAYSKAFRDKCPASLSAYESLKQLDDSTELRQPAAKLRALLESSTEPEAAALYPTLWQSEFKLRPTSEHAEVRKQIEKDLERLRSLNLVKSDQWFRTLRDGYKQTSNKEGESWVAEQMILHHPNSGQAFFYFLERWESEHPRPPASEPQEKRNAYGLMRYKAATEWTARWPDNGSVWVERYVATNGLASLPRAEFDAEFDIAADGFMKSLEQNPGLFGGQPPELVLALRYVQWERRIDYAATLIQRAVEQLEKREWHDRLSDQFPPTQKPRFYRSLDARLLGEQLLFQAYLKQKQLDKARAALSQLAVVLTQMKPDESADEQQKAMHAGSQAFYWGLAGELALAEDHKLDALICYDNARRLNPKRGEGVGSGRPDPWTSKLQKLWQELGGTDEGWQAWLNRNEPSKLLTLTGIGAWEKQQKPLADFALTDLQGRKWQLSDLKGKTVFINLWATWCSPCVRELPLIQKLHEQLRERQDVLVLTLNLDDEIGLVEPFVKANKYSFPTLLAARGYTEKMNVYGIPRNWLVSGDGTLQMEAVGFGSDGNAWLKKAVEQIEQVKGKK